MSNYLPLIFLLSIFSVKGLQILTPLKKISHLTMKATTFVKYQGLGNDFILIDNTKSKTPIFSPEQAISICNRNFGIGGIY